MVRSPYTRDRSLETLVYPKVILSTTGKWIQIGDNENEYIFSDWVSIDKGYWPQHLLYFPQCKPSPSPPEGKQIPTFHVNPLYLVEKESDWIFCIVARSGTIIFKTPLLLSSYQWLIPLPPLTSFPLSTCTAPEDGKVILGSTGLDLWAELTQEIAFS